MNAPLRATRRQRREWKRPSPRKVGDDLAKMLRALRPGMLYIDIAVTPNGILVEWEDGQISAIRKDGAVARNIEGNPE